MSCEIFPLVRGNLNLHSDACKMVKNIVSDVRNQFPTTERPLSSKGPLYPLE